MDFKDWLQQHIFTATDLEAYLLCPYRFYAQSFLKLRPPMENEVELTPPEVGQLVHRVLERFLSQRELPAKSFLDEELEKFQKGRNHLSPVLLNFQKKRMERMLASFVEDLEKEQSEERTLSPRYFEWSFGRGQVPPLVLKDAEGHPFSLRGRIDRIDVDPIEKRFLVIDYKTGSTKVSGSQIVGGESFQLPLYLLAVQQLLLPDYEPIGAIYYQLSDMSKKDGLLHAERLPGFLTIHSRSSSLIPAGRWEPVIETIRNQIGQIVSKIRQTSENEFVSKKDPCEPFCSYQDICRLRASHP